MKRGFWRALIILVAIIRALFPFIIFNHPFLAYWINFFTDAPDGYISYKAGWRWKTYHLYDKIFDGWWYLFVTLYAREFEIFPIVLVLFVLRIIGQTASAFSREGKFLYWFPNILEPYFGFYLILTKLFGIHLGVLSLGNFALLAVSALFAFSTERRIHMKKKYLANAWFKLRIVWEDNEPKD